MRMAYLIVAHGDRTGLERLVSTLLPVDSPDQVIVHADARSGLWKELARGYLIDDPRVRVLSDPVPVIWGHWSQVEATRRLMQAAIACEVDYAHLLSGVDWPVADRAAIVSDIAAAPEGTCYIEAVPGMQEERMQTWRLDTRWLRPDRHSEKLAYILTWEMRRLSRYADGLRERLGHIRSRPFGPWCKGSCWWSLPRDALISGESDLRHLIRNGRLRGTVCADEHALPTVIAHRFAERLSGNRRFIDFAPGASSPRTLTRDDLPAIKAGNYWFARKVDAAVDPFFLDLP